MFPLELYTVKTCVIYSIISFTSHIYNIYVIENIFVILYTLIISPPSLPSRTFLSPHELKSILSFFCLENNQWNETNKQTKLKKKSRKKTQRKHTIKRTQPETITYKKRSVKQKRTNKDIGDKNLQNTIEFILG